MDLVIPFLFGDGMETPLLITIIIPINILYIYTTNY